MCTIEGVYSRIKVAGERQWQWLSCEADCVDPTAGKLCCSTQLTSCEPRLGSIERTINMERENSRVFVRASIWRF